MVCWVRKWKCTIPPLMSYLPSLSRMRIVYIYDIYQCGLSEIIFPERYWNTFTPSHSDPRDHPPVWNMTWKRKKGTANQRRWRDGDDGGALARFCWKSPGGDWKSFTSISWKLRTVFARKVCAAYGSAIGVLPESSYIFASSTWFLDDYRDFESNKD